ncbi:MAG: type II secretion system GspH family protein [Pseudomonadota bacterium]|nr:type II secretion system GspH family protein [Pseudomonadota bacterium]
MSPSRKRAARAFTLLEAMIALVIVALLASGLAVPLAAQVQMRRHEETRRTLEEARDALLGFVAAHGRLPCPATAESLGLESFASGGDAANGRCANFHAGLLPGAALGLSALDAEGFLRDGWGGVRNRVRYAVHAGTIDSISHALTRANGLQMATLPGLGAAPHYLFVCTHGAAASASGCGPAASQLTRRAAFVLLSTGANGALEPPPGTDEAKNLDGDASFVSREAGTDFDDLLHWGAIHLVINRMVVAGRLP